ncbi:hypothetical protein NDU88_005153 [Pleurodeles waltl]|uniref:Uncharacterized protein n=1 Tax=Pleurodeles waltl TaxID=8319 RepID=A0AAV7RK55_PLEWA|nr:hypothetical protein NDU88_005153 [Pleurodeles waltl]
MLGTSSMFSLVGRTAVWRPGCALTSGASFVEVDCPVEKEKESGRVPLGSGSVGADYLERSHSDTVVKPLGREVSASGSAPSQSETRTQPLKGVRPRSLSVSVCCPATYGSGPCSLSGAPGLFEVPICVMRAVEGACPRALSVYCGHRLLEQQRAPRGTLGSICGLKKVLLRLPAARDSAPTPFSSPCIGGDGSNAGLCGSELVCWPASAALSLEPSCADTLRGQSCD